MVDFSVIKVHPKAGCSAFLANVRQLHLHTLRAFSAVTNELGSTAERHHLMNALKKSKETTRHTTNLIVWRRSTLVLLMFASVVAFIFQLLGVYDDYLEYDENLQVALGNTTYDPFIDVLSFRNYSARVSKVSYASAMRDIKYAHFWSDLGALVLTAIALGSTAAALNKWDSYGCSYKWMLFTWLLSFAGPFGISLVPTRQLVNWDRFDADSALFIDGFEQHFEFDKRKAQVVESCTTFNAESTPTITTARRQIDRLCDAIGKGDNFVGNLFSGGAASSANDKCEEARVLLSDGRVDEAVAKGQETCTGVLDVVDKFQTGDEKDLQLVQLMADMVPKAQQGASMAISLVNALFTFKVLMPAAAALSPALLRGALKVKVLVPQSTIPGMFVVILPWLYSPLVWTVYNVVFQLVGDMYLFIALFLLAFAPMVYVIVGTQQHVTQPMDDEKVARVIKILARSNMLVSLVALISLVLFLVETKKSNQNNASAQKAVDNFLRVRVFVEIVFNTAHKWLLTTAAGVDFMIGEIAAQRKFEVFLETQNVSGFVEQRGPGAMAAIKAEMDRITKATGDRTRIKAMMTDRFRRLDELCQLLAITNHVPEHQPKRMDTGVVVSDRIRSVSGHSHRHATTTTPPRSHAGHVGHAGHAPPSHDGHDAQWAARVDPGTGRTYYHNLMTNETTWIRPAELPPSFGP